MTGASPSSLAPLMTKLTQVHDAATESWRWRLGVTVKWRLEEAQGAQGRILVRALGRKLSNHGALRTYEYSLKSWTWTRLSNTMLLKTKISTLVSCKFTFSTKVSCHWISTETTISLWHTTLTWPNSRPSIQTYPDDRHSPMIFVPVCTSMPQQRLEWHQYIAVCDTWPCWHPGGWCWWQPTFPTRPSCWSCPMHYQTTLRVSQSQ